MAERRKRQHPPKAGADTGAEETLDTGTTDEETGEETAEDSEPVEQDESDAPSQVAAPVSQQVHEARKEPSVGESEGSKTYADLMKVTWKPKRRRR